MDQAAHKPTPPGTERENCPPGSWAQVSCATAREKQGSALDPPAWSQALDCSMVFTAELKTLGVATAKILLRKGGSDQKSQCSKTVECGRWPPQLFLQDPRHKRKGNGGIPLVVTLDPACKGLTISIQLKNLSS